jgi:hypothetical protein
MRWRFVVGTAWLLFAGTGCPHDWMKDGTNDRAMARDTDAFLDEQEQQRARSRCPEGQTWKRICKQNPGGGELDCVEGCR